MFVQDSPHQKEGGLLYFLPHDLAQPFYTLYYMDSIKLINCILWEIWRIIVEKLK